MLANPRVTGDVLEFDLVRATPRQALDLRLKIMDIPTLAIHDVCVHEGPTDSDEKLAHALGLIPVVSYGGAFAPRYAFPDECGCRGTRCPTCAVLFRLHKTGPCFVSSDDFESSDPAVRLYPKVLFAHLKENETLKIEACAIMGRRETKWQCSAPPPFFTNPVSVVVNPKREITLAQKRDLVAACPARVFVLDEIEDLRVDPAKKCIGCEECVRKGLDYREAVTDPWLVGIEYDTTTFQFKVESAGQLLPSTIWTCINNHQ